MSPEVWPWVAGFLSVSGILLNAKKIICCWWVWNAANLIWIVLAWSRSDWAQVVTWLTFTAANIYGFVSWKRERRIGS